MPTASLTSSAPCVVLTSATLISGAFFVSSADAVASGVTYPYALQLPADGDDVGKIPWFSTPVTPALPRPPPAKIAL